MAPELNQPTYQTAPVNCPNCGNRFVTPVLSVIDVGRNRDLKTLLLSGQLNIAVCPQCGHAGMLSVPLVYHDPEKELLFTFAPAEAEVGQPDRERVIGSLTNQVISALPPEQRKGYLLQPRTFLRLNGMIEAILEADGITPEMLEAQRAKAALLERLLRATSDEARQAIVRENDGQIDYEFFQLLTLNIELAQSEGQDETAGQLLALRGQLLDWTTHGQGVAAREEALRSLGDEVTREELLDKIVEAALAGEEAKVETMAAVARPVIDYIFYQQLTARIEAAEGAGDSDRAGKLRALRETILDLTAQIDAELQQATEQASQDLQEILASDDLEQAIRDKPGRIDEFFLNALATNLAAAEQAGRTDDVQKLQQVSDAIMKLIQESQPPEVQLINQLLAAEYPTGSQALLEEKRDLVNSDLLELMRVMAEDLSESDRGELSQRLDQIREQAATMVEGQPFEQAGNETP
jgi:hypothetical protein